MGDPQRQAGGKARKATKKSTEAQRKQWREEKQKQRLRQQAAKLEDALEVAVGKIDLERVRWQLYIDALTAPSAGLRERAAKTLLTAPAPPETGEPEYVAMLRKRAGQVLQNVGQLLEASADDPKPPAGKPA